MHVILGALIIASAFGLALQYMSQDFDGFLNYYSIILLVGVPLGGVILTYRFTTLWEAIVALGRSIVGSPGRERDRIAKNLLAFGREVRRDKALQASAILEQEKDPVFRVLGRLVLQKTDAEEIEADALVLGRRELSGFRQGERVFSTLGDLAPAMGMIGTVIGLIQLLANMRDFEKLGPGMAIALLTTFYGLILAHLVYLPLSRMIADYGARRAENLSMIADGMMKIARRRPLHELSDVVGADLNVQALASSGNN